MEAALEEKKERLASYLRKLGKVAVAFSGGVDSTFLLAFASEVLKENVLAINVCSQVITEKEAEATRAFCAERKIPYEQMKFDVFSVPGFAANPVDRCYLCKRTIMGSVLEKARAHGIEVVVEGSNMDDTGDYRPGVKALRELGILSPMQECGLYKDEIRALSKEMGLKTWDKPGAACLASRFVYGEEITGEKLAMVAKAEEYIFSLGLRQCRVRIHGKNMARLEVLPEDFDLIFSAKDGIVSELKKLGFTYITLDLGGFRSGSMNEGIV